jgi:hypothetical protein
MVTLYYDSDTGNNANAGTVGSPRATIENFTTATVRTAGDIAILRGGRTNLYSGASDVALAHDESGTAIAPIIVQADYDNDFGDHVNISSTATATLTFGSPTITFTADVSGVISAGQMLYQGDDDPYQHAYEVSSVSTNTATLKLPYLGDNAGSGKTMWNMLAMPIFGTTTSNNRSIAIATRNFWQYQGLRIRTNAAQCFSGTGSGTVIKDCSLEGGAGTVKGIVNTSVTAHKISTNTAISEGVASPGIVKVSHSLLNSAATTGKGINQQANSLVYADNCLTTSGGIGLATNVDGNVYINNCDFSDATIDIQHTAGTTGGIYVTDYNHVRGDSRYLNKLSSNSANPIVFHSISLASPIRTGGGAVVAKILPSANVSTNEAMRIIPIKINLHKSTVKKTYKVFFKSDATTNWTANPTASELFLELEFYDTSSHTYKRTDVSTGTLNFTGSTDVQYLTISATPTVSGIGILRVVYGKPKESGKSNEFKIDPVVAIT